MVTSDHHISLPICVAVSRRVPPALPHRDSQLCGEPERLVLVGGPHLQRGRRGGWKCLCPAVRTAPLAWCLQPQSAPKTKVLPLSTDSLRGSQARDASDHLIRGRAEGGRGAPDGIRGAARAGGAHRAARAGAAAGFKSVRLLDDGANPLAWCFPRLSPLRAQRGSLPWLCCCPIARLWPPPR